VIQKKTGRPVQFEITEQTRSAIGDWVAACGVQGGGYLFPSRARQSEMVERTEATICPAVSRATRKAAPSRGTIKIEIAM
jgi:hypothetical protein